MVEWVNPTEDKGVSNQMSPLAQTFKRAQISGARLFAVLDRASGMNKDDGGWVEGGWFLRV